MRKLLAPILAGIVAIGCGNNYGNADCVETVQTEQGDRPEIVRAYTDENGNGTLDTLHEYVCRTREGSLGLDKDCWVNETHLLDNSFSNYHARRDGGMTGYSEIGKGTPQGEGLQGSFEACKAKDSE